MLTVKGDVCQLGYKNAPKNPTYEIAEKKHNHTFPSTQRMTEKS